MKKRNENQVAAGDPGEQGEPRGRVRGGRLQPAAQPLGQDWPARKRDARQVLESSKNMSKSRNIFKTVICSSKDFPQNQPTTQVGSKSRSRPSGDSLEARTGVQINPSFLLLLLNQIKKSGVHAKVHGELVVSPSSGRKVLEFVCIQVSLSLL